MKHLRIATPIEDFLHSAAGHAPHADVHELQLVLAFIRMAEAIRFRHLQIVDLKPGATYGVTIGSRGAFFAMPEDDEVET